MTGIINIEPDLRLVETWSWLTDVMVSHNRTEQRISIRSIPRLAMQYGYDNLDEGDRAELFEAVETGLTELVVSPLFQFAVRLSASAAIGASTVVFDNQFGPMEVGSRFAILDTETGDIFSSVVDASTPTGITMQGSLPFDVDTNAIICPAVQSTVTTDSFAFDQVTGRVDIQTKSFRELLPVQRSASTAVLTTFDSITVLERTPLSGVTDKLEYRREEFDPASGFQFQASRDPNAVLTRQLVFNIKRFQDPEDYDYWRLFFDTIKGAWQAFLLPTFLSDLTFTSTPGDNASLVTINEPYISDQLGVSEAFKRFQIEYEDGTVSRHTITAIDQVTDDSARLAITPATPTDFTSRTVKRISFLVKVRGSDVINWDHRLPSTLVRFDVTATDQ